MSSFGPVASWKKPISRCVVCNDELPHRLWGISLDANYRMVGPVCGHRWPQYKGFLPNHVMVLMAAKAMRTWHAGRRVR